MIIGYKPTILAYKCFDSAPQCAPARASCPAAAVGPAAPASSWGSPGAATTGKMGISWEKWDISRFFDGYPHEIWISHDLKVHIGSSWDVKHVSLKTNDC